MRQKTYSNNKIKLNRNRNNNNTLKNNKKRKKIKTKQKKIKTKRKSKTKRKRKSKRKYKKYAGGSLSSDEINVEITNQDDYKKVIRVKKTDNIYKSVKEKYLRPEEYDKDILIQLGEEVIGPNDTYEIHNMENNARLSISVSIIITDIDVIIENDNHEDVIINVNKNKTILGELRTKYLIPENGFNNFHEIEKVYKDGREIDYCHRFKFFEIDNNSRIKVDVMRDEHERDCGLNDGHDQCTCQAQYF